MKKEKIGARSSFSALLPELMQLFQAANAQKQTPQVPDTKTVAEPRMAEAEHPYVKILRRHEAISRRIDEAEAARRGRKE